jgi:hypothetical protein
MMTRGSVDLRHHSLNHVQHAIIIFLTVSRDRLYGIPSYGYCLIWIHVVSITDELND